MKQYIGHNHTQLIDSQLYNPYHLNCLFLIYCLYCIDNNIQSLIESLA
jgi:hypothetical protein